MTAQTSSAFTLSDHPSSRSSTLLSISIKSEEDETGETDPKLLDLSLTRSHDGDEPDQEIEELGAFALNETSLILLGQEVVQVSLDLDGTRETDLKPLLKVHEQRRSQITVSSSSFVWIRLIGFSNKDGPGFAPSDLTPHSQFRTHPYRQDIIVTILHLQLHHHPLPDHFILLDSEFELNCCKSLDPSFQRDPSELHLLIIFLLPSTDQQSWAVMRSRWSWSLNGRPIEGRKKKWRFVLGAPLKPSLV
ncbi:BQ5605_C001g00849 [Microbotryum silenes-dioicae]|uniref:BQ5605_C001g00849 protein n=1 Tax=Microbotryum silenes-dioicae TaxID=796604 RepID=A0A2X0M7R9_9BASI|nr:BQ5605_C001g00849 [Microbotryum silenes-dioicae]